MPRVEANKTAVAKSLVAAAWCDNLVRPAQIDCVIQGIINASETRRSTSI